MSPRSEPEQPVLTLRLIQEAAQRIEGNVHRTPVMTSATLDAAAQASLFFKCENLQKIGAFKARGATNAVFALAPEHAQRGVATHSSGNHGAALARAARLRGIPAYVVMPRNAARVKRESVERQGARIVFCEPTQQARETTLRVVIDETGATLIHPYNDLLVMAGQGTAAAELIESVPDLDIIVSPVGGGGLLSGTAVAAKYQARPIRVVGVEPAAADDAARSFKSGRIVPSIDPRTIADGLRTSLGDKTFKVIAHHVDDIVTVSEESIVAAMRRLWEVMKILVEPSSAVPYAAIAEAKIDIAGKKVGVILTGGNVDLDALPWIRGGR